MEKEATPADKMEETAPLVPENKGSAKEETAPLVPENKESAKEETVAVVGAMPLVPGKEEESIKEETGRVEVDTAAGDETAKEDAPVLPCTSCRRNCACETMEESGPENEAPATESLEPCSSCRRNCACEAIEESEQENEPQVTEGCPRMSTGKMTFLFGAASLICVIAGAWFLNETSNSEEYQDVVHYAVLASTCFLLCLYFLFLTLYYGKFACNPALLLWGAGTATSQYMLYRSMRYRDVQTDTENEDLENRQVGSTSSEYLEATDKQQNDSNQSTDAPSQEGASSSGVPSEKQPILQPTASKGDSAAKISEVASAVSQIASETIKEGPAESVKEKQTRSKEQNVEKSDDSQPKDSEQEGLSSTELRRRNFQNPDSCGDLTKPSDEVKKE